ncbi:MAG: hypothetical protein KAR20_22460 [Candidatus Heimdallarchaeota archaeon]|nr:hypothetical protein [Candidatus Heimdallarchaeota archaeon]
MKSPNELLQELKELVSNIEKDADKSTRGMKAAGIRLRASMQEVRDLAIAIRKSVLDYRTASSIAPEQEELNEIAKPEEIELVQEEILVEAPAPRKITQETPQLNRDTSYWYSDFSY